ncbi:cytidine deaminase-like isoform X1 [Bradysia coprophila]|uniref:cytidine deaminase-like isoform X1 n=1 Tax=Bradysia coprophila TaxID=38358 RepID=UPI00187D7CB3|nr:cytidine deaminase-like isoform X1 [Bradysia coprophila]
MESDINGTLGNVEGGSIQEYSNLDPSAKELIQAAIKVRNNAYAVYSNFQVGSALRTTTGEIFTGCNVENGAYSPSVCAERTAICKAVSEGHREIAAIAVVAYQEHSFTTPCGVCRQFISEFTTKDIPVYVAKPAPVRVLVTSIRQLLPMTFVPVI